LTAPTITHGQGFLADCNSKTGWTEESAKTLTATSNTVADDDVFDITGTASAAAQHTYWECDLANLSSDVYAWIVVRYKTSDASAGLAAKVELVFTDGTQTVLGTAFSSAWAIKAVAVTAGKIIDKIRLYAVSDSACGAGHHVYYDFALICRGGFTFPSVSGSLHFEMNNVYADLPIPSRIGDETQYMGMNCPDIVLNGRVDVSTAGWGIPLGEYLMLIMQEASADPFQWFTSDMVNCKVTPRHLSLDQDGEALRTWRFDLKQFSRSGGQQTTWNDLQFWGV
jgi:hypothetical protein